MNRDRKIHSVSEYKKLAKENILVFKWIWDEIISDLSKNYAIKMIIFMGLSTLIVSINPIFIKKLVDIVSVESKESVDLNLFWVISGALVFSILVQKYLKFIGSKYREWQEGLNRKSIDHYITELFFQKSMGQHDREKSKLNQANLEKGRNRTFNVIWILLFDCPTTMLTLFISYFFLWIFSWEIAVMLTIALAAYLIWSFFLSVSVAIECDPIDFDYRKLHKYRVTRWADAWRVQLANKESAEVDLMDDEFDGIFERDRNFWIKFSKKATYRELIIGLTVTLIVIYSAYNTYKGLLTVGDLFPIAIWTGNFTQHMWRLADIERALNYFLPSVKTLKETLSIEPDIVSLPNAYKLNGEPLRISVQGVSYRHQKSVLDEEKNKKEFPIVIKDVSFDINAGEKVACIGPSGSGKSTLAKLLLRFSDPLSGEILVNGIPLREIDLQSYRSNLSYIPQRPSVFDGTVEDNLIYDSDSKLTEDGLGEIVKRLQIDFGERLVDGLQTTVGWEGITLSGGQQQRLMAGSAIAKRPKFIVIDEATSSLDSTTEKAFQRGLETLLDENAIAFVIAHRLSTVRNCDKFIVLKPTEGLRDGESQVEAISDNFTDLYKESPTFRSLANDQDLRID